MSYGQYHKCVCTHTVLSVNLEKQARYPLGDGAAEVIALILLGEWPNYRLDVPEIRRDLHSV